MLFFTAIDSVAVSRNRIRQEFGPRPASATDSPLAPLYVTSLHDFMALKKRLAASGQQSALHPVDEDRVLQSESAPVELGTSNRGEAHRYQARLEGRHLSPPFRPLEEQLDLLGDTDAPRTAIINGFGTGIGDYIVGLTAWRVARERILRAGFSDVTTEIWARTHGVPRARLVCETEPSITGIRTLPVSGDEFAALDGFWDLSGLLDRPGFREMPTVDFFLECLGVDPASVDDADKRNRIHLPGPVINEVDAALSCLDRPFVLLHTLSSTPLRNMPTPIIRRVLDEFAACPDFQVASLHTLPLDDDRYLDLSGLFRSHWHFCATVSRASGLLSVDTSTYHVADAFGIPSLVVFTTVPPERWIRYYPTVEAVMLDGVRESEFLGLHVSDDPRVLSEIGRYWERLDVVALVQRFLDQVRGAGLGGREP